jgi:FdhD protein
MSARETQHSTVAADIWLLEEDRATPFPDTLATEAPLEIRLRIEPAGEKAQVHPLAVTMRTPGADGELALGFLYSEGVLESREDVVAIDHPRPPGPRIAPQGGGGIVELTLRPGLVPPLEGLERHFYTTSACGLCGKASLEALLMRRAPRLPTGPRIEPTVLYRLPEVLRGAQGLFQSTGGLHAAALFTHDGALLAAREDVGRHNALDKLIGWALDEGLLPLHEHLILVSGRTSYELVQKALLAEVPVLAAVSAPSSLAVATAREHGMTLVGFLREQRLNVYSGGERLGLEG